MAQCWMANAHLCLRLDSRSLFGLFVYDLGCGAAWWSPFLYTKLFNSLKFTVVCCSACCQARRNNRVPCRMNFNSWIVLRKMSAKRCRAWTWAFTWFQIFLKTNSIHGIEIEINTHWRKWMKRKMYFARSIGRCHLHNLNHRKKWKPKYSVRNVNVTENTTTGSLLACSSAF